MENEQVSIPVQPAGFWLRVWAKVFDLGVFNTISLLLFAFLAVLHVAGVPGGVLPFLILLLPVIWLAYFTYYTSRGRQTVGYRLCGIVVKRPDGSEVSVARAFTRTLLNSVAYSLVSYIIGLVDYIAAAFPGKRTLHDMLTETVVIRVTTGVRRPALASVTVLAMPIVLLFGIVRPFVAQTFYIPSGGMIPTLEKNDHIFVSKLHYRIRDIKHGDVVVFLAPPEAAFDGKERDFVQRVIGLPGDTINVVAEKGVYRNGRLLREPYIFEVPMYDMKAVKVPRSKVFVMGDNRNNSNDSHVWGPVGVSRVRGKAVVTFWPLRHVRGL